MNEILLFFFGTLVALGVVALLNRGTRSERVAELAARVDELSKALHVIGQNVDARLREAFTAVERGQTRAEATLGRVSGQLGEQREALSRIVDVQRDLKRFQDLLQPPKARGGVGEQLLEQLLADILPQGEGIGQYQRQAALKSGERVDFLLRLKDFTVPIDAKFPLESYERLRRAEGDEERTRAEGEFRRAVKQHVESVARKYVRPEEGTAEFAFLYIPSEAVALSVLDDAQLLDFAFDRKVIIVSPRTFFAYLRTVLIGLRGFAVEESAKELLGALGSFEGEMRTLGDRFRIVGGHLRNALKAYEETERQMTRITENVAGWTKRRGT